jgi:hypothetical protein
MLRLAARDTADVLLPRLAKQSDTPGYGHWWHNDELLLSTETKGWAW